MDLKKIQILWSGKAQRAILLSIAIVIVGELFLVWQYNRLVQDRIPEIEQQIEQQHQRLEQQAAEQTVRAFLRARFAQNIEGATMFFTEGAMESWQQGEFYVTSDYYENYTIEEVEAVDEDRMRFRVTITRSEGLPDQVEIITTRKIPPLDSYYIESISIAE